MEDCIRRAVRGWKEVDPLEDNSGGRPTDLGGPERGGVERMRDQWLEQWRGVRMGPAAPS